MRAMKRFDFGNGKVWRVLAVLLALAVMSILLFGCDISLLNRQTQEFPTEESSSPVAPAPVPTAPAEAVARVSVVELGFIDCTPPPDQLEPAPCKVKLTCTPKDSAGNDVGLSYTPTWSVQGLGGITPQSANPYNANGECDAAPGSVFFQCEVGGVIGTHGYECIL